MTNKRNIYDELYDVDEEDTVTIPDFVEDKTGKRPSSMTDSTSVDMSLFKMSDDELYDDDDDETDSREPRRKGSGASLALCLVLIFLLLATSAAAVFYALKQRNAYKDVYVKYEQLQAQQSEYQKQIDSKDQMIDDLNRQIEELKKTPAKTTDKTYVVTDGPLTFRDSASVDGSPVTFQGKEQAKDGEQYEILEIIEHDDDPGRYWGKLAEDVYIQMGYGEDMYVEPVN